MIRIEGNKGGDYLIIAEHKDNLVKMEIGHCCVVHGRLILPIEIITAILADLFTDLTLNSDQAIEKIPWDEEHTRFLMKQIKKLSSEWEYEIEGEN